MIVKNGIKLFGAFRGLPYGSPCTENFDEYRTYKNKMPKEKIIRHIEKLDPALACLQTFDIFTGEEIIPAGIYEDGEFIFPTDFLYYYKNYDIGIPLEYESYIASKDN